MSEEPLKTLASLVLQESQKTTLIIGVLGNLLERAMEKDDFDGNANALRPGIEQLSALSRDSKEAIEQAKNYFGLDDSPSK